MRTRIEVAPWPQVRLTRNELTVQS
jgi:hypothetical protein